MLENKTHLISSLILSLGIMSGCYLLASKPAPAVIDSASKSEVQVSILLNLKETSVLLGISEEELKKIMAEEKRILNTTGSYDGAMLPYIVIEGKQYFERTQLLIWAQESAALHKEYGL
ncbi:hypothetical protein [Neobacillus niacini]|uniref:hypothetical protein n=1 Tax=Neobacillus niacini TaxID=86668 RepID=UPI0005EE1287|nr:hypothetical protein [Neobacillus niacini]